MDRRSFIKRGALTAGALVAAPALVRAQELTPVLPRVLGPVKIRPPETYSNLEELNKLLRLEFPHHNGKNDGIYPGHSGRFQRYHQAAVSVDGWMYFVQLCPLVERMDTMMLGGTWEAHCISPKRLMHTYMFSLGFENIRTGGDWQFVRNEARRALHHLLANIRKWDERKPV